MWNEFSGVSRQRSSVAMAKIGRRVSPNVVHVFRGGSESVPWPAGHPRPDDDPAKDPALEKRVVAAAD